MTGAGRAACGRSYKNMNRLPNVITRRQRVLLLVGSLGPLGHCPASGTVTVVVAGLPLFWFLQGVPQWAYAAGTIVFLGLSVWLHDIGDRLLLQKDSRQLVWDELGGFLIAIAFVPFTWRIAVVAVILERVLDITKFPPANWIEKQWPGGYGVVGDDIVAGIYTCAILHLLIGVAGPAFGVDA